MTIQTSKIKGNVRAITNRVLVSDMYFGEQRTASGLIITSDDGKTRGIYPRWAKVYHKGPQNNDPYQIGDWILVEHGRWTRGFTLETEKGDLVLRMVEAESVLAYSEEKPEGVYIGDEYGDTSSPDVRPEDFTN